MNQNLFKQNLDQDHVKALEAMQTNIGFVQRLVRDLAETFEVTVEHERRGETKVEIVVYEPRQHGRCGWGFIFEATPKGVVFSAAPELLDACEFTLRHCKDSLIATVLAKAIAKARGQKWTAYYGPYGAEVCITKYPVRASDGQSKTFNTYAEALAYLIDIEKTSANKDRDERIEIMNGWNEETPSFMYFGSGE